MKGLTAVIVILLGASFSEASGYYLSSNGYYCDGTNYYTRTAYYTAGYYQCGYYYPGVYSYQYTLVPSYVAPTKSDTIDDALKRYDKRILEDAATMQAFKARGINPSAFYGGLNYGGGSIFGYPSGATLYGTQSNYTSGYGGYSLNTTASTNAVLDLNALVNLQSRNATNALALAGQVNGDTADLTASAIKIAEINAKRDTVIAAIQAANQKPSETQFRTFQLTINPPAAPGQLPQIQGANELSRTTMDTDPAIKAAIGVLQMDCAACHSDKNAFRVNDFFNLPISSDNPKQLTLSMLKDRLVKDSPEHPRMPKNAAALSIQKQTILDLGWLQARKLGVPLQPVVPANTPSSVPPTPIGPPLQDPMMKKE